MLSPAHAARPARFVRLARWRQSWRLALRLARRDARSHKGRSLLIMIMVVAPVLLVGTFATWFATTEVSVIESLPTRLGAAQAEITEVDHERAIQQLADGSDHSSVEEDVQPFESHQPGTEWTAEQLSALTGGRIVEAAYPVMFATAGGRLTRLSCLALPAAELPTSGLATLVSGRWPTAPDEVAVTETGRSRGLPANGTVTVRGTTAPAERPVRVVGVVSAFDSERRPLDLVTGNPAAARADTPWATWSYLVFRDSAVTWAEVRDWNRYGLLVVSRAVLLDPPPASQQPAQLRQQASGTSAVNVAVVALVTLGLLLETTLLAGPAFAVSAARRRRALAQVAANGADRAQLRRYVLAEALLLGAGAALLGAGLSILLGWAASRLERAINPWASVGPPDVPWLGLAGLVVTATASAVVAGLVPARGASRIRIADVLAGRERSEPIRRFAPLLGLLLVAGAAGVLAMEMMLFRSGATPWLEAGAAATLVIGVLLLVPVLLVALGRAARRLPLPVRLPVRDAARQRSRSAAAVAAVTATVATLTILAVANASDDRHHQREYTTDRTAGHGYLVTERQDSPIEETVAEIRRQHPDWLIHRTHQLGTPDYVADRGRRPVVAVVLPGCSPEESIGRDDGTSQRLAECARYGSNGGDGNLVAVSGTSLADVGLTGETTAALASGGMIISDASSVRDGKLTLAIGRSGPAQDVRVVERVIQVPALAVSADEVRRAQRRQPIPSETEYAGSFPTAGLLTIDGAERWQIPHQPMQFEIVDPDGPISVADERAINDHALTELSVERGYVSDVQPLIWGLMGTAAALVLVAALVSTALAQAEGQADLTTLAALGGTVSLRRRLVAGQALLVAGLGTLLGFAAGLLPGSAFAVAFTAYGDKSPGAIVIPWLPLALVVLGVPLLAAAVAALAVRRTPQLTRRLT